MIVIKHKGNFKNTEKYLTKLSKNDFYRNLESYAKEGVAALTAATPLDSGITSNSWGYIIEKKKDKTSITWTNSNTVSGVPVVILLQYGHATKNGGYVQGRDFINPAIQPIFDKIAENVWKEVKS